MTKPGGRVDGCGLVIGATKGGAKGLSPLTKI